MQTCHAPDYTPRILVSQDSLEYEARPTYKETTEKFWLEGFDSLGMPDSNRNGTGAATQESAEGGSRLKQGALVRNSRARKAEPMTVRFVDLFCGAGGLAEGFRLASDSRLRFQSVLGVEIDEAAAASYKANFGHKVFADPIERLSRADLPEDVHLVIGGPPCQGFSPLGKMSPTDRHPEMNQLWQHFFKVIKWLHPVAFVVENVPEFLESVEFQQAEKKAIDLGYKTVSGMLDATHFGVPQRRRRGFLIGMQGVRPEMPEGDEATPTVREAIWRLRKYPLVYNFRNGARDLFGEYTPHEVKTLHIGRNPTEKSLLRYKCIPQGGNRFDLVRKRRDLAPPCWIKKTTGSTDVFGRLKWGAPALTIRTEFFKPEKGCYLHPDQHRPITHWEAAKLQTFPDDYLFCGSKTEIARQIGNAVPPLLAKGIADTLKSLFLKHRLIASAA
jgi:DNA (cytosine-5)-methyltransferase 1